MLPKIWIKSADDDKDTESELKWIYAVDPSYISPLMENYREVSALSGKLFPNKKGAPAVSGERTEED